MVLYNLLLAAQPMRVVSSSMGSDMRLALASSLTPMQYTNTSALELVYHPNVIGIRNEINIDPAVVHVLQLYPVEQLHIVIVNADGILVAVIFKH